MLKRVALLLMFSSPIALAVTSVSELASAADNVACTVASKPEMLATMGIKGMYETTPDELKVFLDKLNAARVANKLFTMDADSMVVVQFEDKTVAIALFFHDCLVPGTAFRGTIQQLYKFLEPFGSLGLLDKIGKVA